MRSLLLRLMPPEHCIKGNPRSLHRLWITLFIMIPLFLFTEKAAAEKISDMGKALEFCRNSPLDRIEGIWEFPEDNTVVLIRLADERKRVYDLIVVTTPDCRLKPGEKIGVMTASIDPDKFHLSLYTSRKDGLLSDPSNCLAVFNEADGSLRVEKRKYKFSLRSSRYLPKFWRMLAMFSSENPAVKLPEGLIRLFPNPFSDSIDRGKPKYL